MKSALLSFALLAPCVAFGQVRAPGAKATPPPSPEQAAAAFAVRPPDEGSPFFAEREAAKYALSQAGKPQNAENTDAVAVYPRTKNSPDSAAAIFSRFFTEMFASVQLGFLKGEGKSTSRLVIEPDPFSLQDRREVDAVFSIRNNTKRIMRLDYPTTQRIEILTKDDEGKVVEKWSDDRAFVDQEGIIFINPKERIEYRESVPTRELKAGREYLIEAEAAANPE